MASAWSTDPRTKTSGVWAQTNLSLALGITGIGLHMHTADTQVPLWFSVLLSCLSWNAHLLFTLLSAHWAPGKAPGSHCHSQVGMLRSEVTQEFCLTIPWLYRVEIKASNSWLSVPRPCVMRDCLSFKMYLLQHNTAASVQVHDLLPLRIYYLCYFQTDPKASFQLHFYHLIDPESITAPHYQPKPILPRSRVPHQGLSNFSVKGWMINTLTSVDWVVCETYLTLPLQWESNKRRHVGYGGACLSSTWEGRRNLSLRSILVTAWFWDQPGLHESLSQIKK